MRQLLINELCREEAERVRRFLESNLRAGGVEGLYWLMIPEPLLGEAQAGHGMCGPFAFAVEAGDDFVSFELLVRSESNLHCGCTCYPTSDQRGFLLAFIDRLVLEESIRA